MFMFYDVSRDPMSQNARFHRYFDENWYREASQNAQKGYELTSMSYQGQGHNSHKQTDPFLTAFLARIANRIC